MQINAVISSDEELFKKVKDHYDKSFTVMDKIVHYTIVGKKVSTQISDVAVRKFRREVEDASLLIYLRSLHPAISSYAHFASLHFSQNLEYEPWGVYDIKLLPPEMPSPKTDEEKMDDFNLFYETSLVNRLCMAREKDISLPEKLIKLSKVAHSEYIGRKPFMEGKTFKEALENMLAVYTYRAEISKIDIPKTELHRPF